MINLLIFFYLYEITLRIPKPFISIMITPILDGMAKHLMWPFLLVIGAQFWYRPFNVEFNVDDTANDRITIGLSFINAPSSSQDHFSFIGPAWASSVSSPNPPSHGLRALVEWPELARLVRKPPFHLL